MTDTNATLANNAALPKAHRHYKFGTFDERLAHMCALFEINPPVLEREDGDVLLTDPLMQWIKQHEINIDWLFCGTPSGLIRCWSKHYKEDVEMLEKGRPHYDA